MCEQLDGVWRWKLRWRRSLFAWVESLLVELLICINNVSKKNQPEDSWWWLCDPSAVYSLKSAFHILQTSIANSSGLANLQNSDFFKKLWCNKVPMKLMVFAWQMILDRIPTKCNLQKRNILNQNQSLTCALCSQHEESMMHLFFNCNFASLIWCKVYACLSFSITL